MTASQSNPIYTVYIVSGSTKYNVTSVLREISLNAHEKQIAQSATIQLMNVMIDGVWLCGQISVRDRVYIYANDGTRNEEVFRGFVWTRTYNSSNDDRDFTLKCYDNLIYFQESEDAVFFSDGKSTEDVFSSLCEKWGIKLSYTYTSITHSKLVLRGNLANIFTADLLDLVKDRTGKKYVVLSQKDVMQVKEVGTNSTIYHFLVGKNASSATSSCTMEGVVTQVVILGKADDEERKPVEATVKGDTSKYGTLQKIIDRDEDTSLEDAKKEAQNIIDADGTPKWEYEIRAVDIPWIQEGDKVYVDAGDIVESYLIVTGIDRTISSKKKEMILTLQKP